MALGCHCGCGESSGETASGNPLIRLAGPMRKQPPPPRLAELLAAGWRYDAVHPQVFRHLPVMIGAMTGNA